VDGFLARSRAAGEALWKKHAARPDDAKIAGIEQLLAKAPAGDPRRPDYELFLGTLQAGKHFDLRLRARAAQRAAAPGGGREAAADREARALDAEASRAFLKAVEGFVAASRAPGFAKADEALYRLAVVLQANQMDDRARDVLAKLLAGHAASKWAAQVRGR
jgi:hypothetical protein